MVRVTRGEARPDRSVNRSLTSKNVRVVGPFTSRSHPWEAFVMRRRAARLLSTEGDGIVGPTTPTRRADRKARCTT